MQDTNKCTQTDDCAGKVQWSAGSGYITDNGTTWVSHCGTCRKAHRRPVNASSGTGKGQAPAVHTVGFNRAGPRLTQILDGAYGRR